MPHIHQRTESIEDLVKKKASAVKAKVAFLDSDWHINRHRDTGVILERWMELAAVSKKSRVIRSQQRAAFWTNWRRAIPGCREPMWSLQPTRRIIIRSCWKHAA